jgi:hypothetical protein
MEKQNKKTKRNHTNKQRQKTKQKQWIGEQTKV